MRLIGRALAVSAVAALAATGTAQAALIEVETDADEFGTGSACALREAVEAARTNQNFGGCPKGSATKRDTVKLIADAVLTIAGDTATNANGDLDYDSGGKLTILGAGAPNPDLPTITAGGALNDRILEISGEKVRLEGLELTGGGDVPDGGAVRARAGSALALKNVELHTNQSSLRGGAVACTGCAILRLSFPFQLHDNTVTGSGNSTGGALYSNGRTLINGQGVGFLGFFSSEISNNDALTAGGFAAGGGVALDGPATIRNTEFAGNAAENSGGGIAVIGTDPVNAKLDRVTLTQNTAGGAVGGVSVSPAGSKLRVRRSAIVDNDSTGAPSTGSAFGGGVQLSHSAATFTDTAIDGNTTIATAATDSTAGAGLFQTVSQPVAPVVKLVRTSVTNNSATVGEQSPRGGGLVIQGRLETVNATISSNSANTAGSDGGGVAIEVSGDGNPSARFEFTTFRDNASAAGDAIRLEGPVRFRASIMDNGTDACVTAAPGLGQSLGFNVENVVDADCGITAPTDAHDGDFLTVAQENGTLPVGASNEDFLDPGIEPFTNAFTNNASAALDLVPVDECEVKGKPLRTDARGALRPVGEACDAGATERVACLGVFLVGPNAYIGTRRRDSITSVGGNDVVLAQGGDDSIGTNTGSDTVCLGPGDDLWAPGAGASDDHGTGGPGRDMVNYNNGGGAGTFDLEAGTAVIGATTDTFPGFEDLQASEGDDLVLGSGGANFLIGGGGDDTIRAKGGIDIIDAREGAGDPDLEINCGPGDDSKEKAITNPEDPEPISC